MAAMLATREDIDTMLGGQRPPYKLPDFPCCYASDLKVPKSHKEAMLSENAHLWEDSTGHILCIAGCRDFRTVVATSAQ